MQRARITGRAAGLALLLCGLAPSRAAQGEPVCLKCHSSIAAALQKKVVHPAVTAGCTSCHINHRDPQAAGDKAPQHLKAAPPELCWGCHDAKDAKIAAAHQGQPFERAICTRCHDPHSSDSPKLMPPRSHGPFAARQCDACHQPSEDGKVRLAAAANELCFRCHEDMKGKIAAAKFKHTLVVSEANSCVDCHDPHAGNLEFALRKPVKELCMSCHAGIIEGQKFLHEPVRISCTLCHNPHATDFPKNLYATANNLCLECHSVSNAQRIVGGAQPVVLFNGRVNLPSKPFDELRWLMVKPDATGGHPIPNHPLLRPAQNGRPEVTCLSCHRAHAGSGGRRRFVTESPNMTKLCIRCH